ncbi:MAG: hypothetical protein ACYDCK_14195 [Thermoplasmatota archaeon]
MAKSSAAATDAPYYDPAGPACNAWTPALARTPAYMAETSHLLIFTALVVAQGIMHFPEHVAQLLQKFYTGQPPNGMLGQFNLEWVHFTYNTGLLLLMIPILIGCGFFARNNAWKRYNKTAWAGVLFSFWVQVWHEPEHYAKLAQYYQTGKQGTPGLVGYWLVTYAHIPTAVVWLHFWVNLIVLVPLVYAYFAYDVLGALRARFFPATSPQTTGARV